MQDFVGEDYLARFVVALVREQLDLREIMGSYRRVLVSRRHLYSRKNFKLNRAAALTGWRELSAG